MVWGLLLRSKSSHPALADPCKHITKHASLKVRTLGDTNMQNLKSIWASNGNLAGNSKIHKIH